MQSLRTIFPNVSNRALTTQLLAHAEEAIENFGCKIDIEAFNYSSAVTSSGFAIPVTYGEEKGLLRVLKPEAWELKELPVLKVLNGQGAVSLIASNQNTIDGKVIENVHLLERTRNSHKLANMVLVEGRDDDATRIMTGVVRKIHNSPSALSAKKLVRDYSGRAGRIQNALNEGHIPDRLIKAFTKVAGLQKEYTASKHTLLHGRPGHYNIVQTENRPTGPYVATNFDPLWGPPSADYPFIITNPWNIETVTAPDRMRRQVSIISEMTKIPKKELYNAVVIHAGLASCWAPLNPARKGNVDHASLSYWERVMENAAQLAKFNLK